VHPDLRWFAAAPAVKRAPRLSAAEHPMNVRLTVQPVWAS